MNRISIALLTTVFAIGLPAIASAEGPHVAPVKAYVADNVDGWLDDPVVIEAVKAQNAAHAGITQADIDAMDGKWREETGASSKPMIDEVLTNELSAFLKERKEESGGLISEVFVMDNKGLNVGQSDVTSDYWQGDEAKFEKSFGAGADAVFVDEIEEDESSQTLQSQVSKTVVDPQSGEAIGAVTVGINVDNL
ncbi:hypothetical protein B7H23_03605 [Notoacmeibacter marinus]|uniref:Uncharacterized protein n=1 Tax=Notoacmeibacter marinus TaxID=1876515 RepID=A0A231V1E9_9HYPH|nr:hypothetical protein [Notoacmeibacter marinus]OXT02029.1 hypothetical protein B7H23_03605 [Notoacmeibacter marinus]